MTAAMTASNGTSRTFSPSSYPPTSPLLPPPPPGSEFLPYSSEYEFVGGPGGPGILLEETEIECGVFDDDEYGHEGFGGDMQHGHGHHGHGYEEIGVAGWKRHTRVYGGGVCLACLSAGGGPGGQGGFYGSTVPLADRR